MNTLGNLTRDMNEALDKVHLWNCVELIFNHGGTIKRTGDGGYQVIVFDKNGDDRGWTAPTFKDLIKKLEGRALPGE